MAAATATTLKPGDLVKYSEPQSAQEADARFDLLKVNDNRVLIRLRCYLPIPPVETVLVTDVAPAEA